jgi:hypothetical protein
MTPHHGRRSVVLAVVGLLLALAAGCSGTSDSPDGDASDSRDRAMRFAECLRDEGVTDFPDPDSSGTYSYDGLVNEAVIDPESAAWKTAIAACNDLQPSGFMGRRRTAEQQEHAVEFAQCMRENGVPDFPDPTAEGPLIDTNRIPSAADDAGVHRVDAAMKVCGAQFAGRLGLTE